MAYFQFGAVKCGVVDVPARMNPFGRADVLIKYRKIGEYTENITPEG